MPQHRGRTLVMTIGTGNRDRLDDTLYTPLLKSVADGDWKTIVLLPSQETRLYAEELRGRIAHGTPGIEVSISPLHTGHENNADRAYAHFDCVLTDVLRNSPPENVEADFTRGHKGHERCARAGRNPPNHSASSIHRRGSRSARHGRARLRTGARHSHDDRRRRPASGPRTRTPAPRQLRGRGARASPAPWFVGTVLSRRFRPHGEDRSLSGTILRRVGPTRSCSSGDRRSSRASLGRLAAVLANAERARLGGRPGTGTGTYQPPCHGRPAAQTRRRSPCEW